MIVGGGFLAIAATLRSLLSGGRLVDYVHLIGVMTVLGLTVGALVGPLIGSIFNRRRGGFE
mgnify:CR=1 FL=1